MAKRLRKFQTPRPGRAKPEDRGTSVEPSNQAHDGLVFEKFGPSDTELYDLAYSGRYQFVSQDWALGASFEQRSIYLSVALDPECEFSSLFMECFFALAGELVYGAHCVRNQYTKKWSPVPAERVDKMKLLLSELEDIDEPRINSLKCELLVLLEHGRAAFDYDFWFESGWRTNCS